MALRIGAAGFGAAASTARLDLRIIDPNVETASLPTVSYSSPLSSSPESPLLLELSPDESSTHTTSHSSSSSSWKASASFYKLK